MGGSQGTIHPEAIHPVHSEPVNPNEFCAFKIQWCDRHRINNSILKGKIMGKNKGVTELEKNLWPDALPSRPTADGSHVPDPLRQQSDPCRLVGQGLTQSFRQLCTHGSSLPWPCSFPGLGSQVHDSTRRPHPLKSRWGQPYPDGYAGHSSGHTEVHQNATQGCWGEQSWSVGNGVLDVRQGLYAKLLCTPGISKPLLWNHSIPLCPQPLYCGPVMEETTLMRSELPPGVLHSLRE